MFGPGVLSKITILVQTWKIVASFVLFKTKLAALVPHANSLVSYDIKNLMWI